MAIILPKKKQQLLRYLSTYISSQGFAPTLTEIAKEFNVSSLATVHEHLEFLQANGFIRRDRQQARGISIIDKRDYPNDNLASEHGLLLPVLGTIAAGHPIEAIEDRSATLAVPPELVGQKNAYVLKVKGDSMIESLIADGDYVVVEKTDYARDGDMVVALLDDGTATLKKFYQEKKYVRLQPANKKYRSIQTRSVVIQGRVLGVVRQY